MEPQFISRLVRFDEAAFYLRIYNRIRLVNYNNTKIIG